MTIANAVCSVSITTPRPSPKTMSVYYFMNWEEEHTPYTAYGMGGHVSYIPIYPVRKLPNLLLVSVIASLACNRYYVHIGGYLSIQQANYSLLLPIANWGFVL